LYGILSARHSFPTRRSSDLEAAIDRVRSLHPEVEVVADSDEMIRTDLDVYAPCALGGSLNDETVPALKAKVVCGSANNQLAHTRSEEHTSELQSREKLVCRL